MWRAIRDRLQDRKQRHRSARPGCRNRVLPERRSVLRWAFAALAGWQVSPSAYAQVTEPPVIFFLYSGRADDPQVPERIATFAAGLAGRGWVLDQDVKLELRFTNTDPQTIAAAAEEVVSLQPAVIFSVATPTTLAVSARAGSIPIVFIQVSDPIGSGLVASLSHPGGTVTGMTNFEPSMSGKWLQILGQLKPGLQNVGVVFNPNTAVRRGELLLEPLRAAASSLGVNIVAFPIDHESQIAGAVAGIAALPESGLVAIPDTFTANYRSILTAAAAELGVPAIYSDRQFTVAGGLVSYGNYVLDHFRLGGEYVGRILDGVPPSDLPVQTPLRLYLSINLGAAATAGIQIPAELRVMADETLP